MDEGSGRYVGFRVWGRTWDAMETTARSHADRVGAYRYAYLITTRSETDAVTAYVVYHVRDGDRPSQAAKEVAMEDMDMDTAIVPDYGFGTLCVAIGNGPAVDTGIAGLFDGERFTVAYPDGMTSEEIGRIVTGQLGRER
jgi:hypothetical protein